MSEIRSKTCQPIIFTDLDGTLLDHITYSFSAALPALELLKKRCIPLVLCSSKTRAEIEYWRERLENPHPFVSENGGAVYIPPFCFCMDDVNLTRPKAEMIDGYFVLALGTPYGVLRRVVEELRRKGFGIKGFGDMTASEVAEITGLSPRQAQLAKRREFDEPFVYQGDQTKLDALLTVIHKKGLRYAQGRFYHLMGKNDKGKAVALLKQIYERKFGQVVTIALGDSPIDSPMLEQVDYPILVRNYQGEHDQTIALPNLIRAEGIGPGGWNEAVLQVIRTRSRS